MIAWFWTALLIQAFCGIVAAIVGAIIVSSNWKYGPEDEDLILGRRILRYGLLATAFCWLGFIAFPVALVAAVGWGLLWLWRFAFGKVPEQ